MSFGIIKLLGELYNKRTSLRLGFGRLNWVGACDVSRMAIIVIR